MAGVQQLKVDLDLLALQEIQLLREENQKLRLTRPSESLLAECCSFSLYAIVDDKGREERIVAPHNCKHASTAATLSAAKPKAGG